MAPCFMMVSFAALAASSSAATTTQQMTTSSKKKTTTTMAGTTVTTTGTTTTTTGLVTTVSGSITLTATGLNKSVVEQAGQMAVAAHYNVSESIVSVNVSESRRLNARLRRLAGTWSINYEFVVPVEKAADVATKVDAATNDVVTFNQAFTQVFKEKLTAAGASSEAVDSIEVTGSTVQSVTPGATTTTTTTTAVVGSMLAYAHQTCASMIAIACMTLVSGM